MNITLYNKSVLKPFCLGIFCVLLAQLSYAQSRSDFRADPSWSELVTAYPETAESLFGSPHTRPAVFRHHTALSAVFDGYVIELIRSPRPLPRNFELFEQFGQIYYDRLESEGSYAYYIMASFDNKRSMRAFFNQIIQPRLPEARLIRYKRGIRKS